MISVLTDPRRRAHLINTLSCVDSSTSGERRLIVVDGVSLPDEPSAYAKANGWEILFAPKPGDANPTSNKWATWAAFCAAATSWEDLLFLEDDVIGSPGACRYACGTLTVPKDCAWVMLYAPWGDENMPWSVARFPASAFSYCQALKIPYRTVVELAAARAEMTYARSGASDECMREVGARRDWLFGVHYPGLFQHAGANDSVVSGPDDVATLTPGRVSKAWLGDIDARALVHRGAPVLFR